MLSEVHLEAPGSCVPTKIVIYQNILLLLQDVCSKPMPSHSREEFSRTQATLDGHLASMRCDNVISGVVASPEHRKVLLEFASKLHLENDSRLREALHADDEGLAAFIVSILVSKSARQTVLALEEDYAQDFLDVVQETLNRGFLMAPDHSRYARRIVRKLSETCDKLPSSLFLTGITHRDAHPTYIGGFGDIYRATHENKNVALKHMRHFVQSSIPEIRDIRAKFCREALIWQDLHHPHILPFLGIDRNSFPSSLCAVSPWMQHGTILKYLKDHGRGNVDRLLYEVAQGLEYLHSCGVVHGDLRGANILITESWTACLADFGLSVLANPATTSMQTSSARAGSLYWMAPELIDPGRFQCKFARTKASDVYAFACVCFELYTGRPSFGELSQAAALLRIVNGERPARPSCFPPISDSLWQRINSYWAERASVRPVTEVVVREMMFPPLTSSRLTKLLPPIPTELLVEQGQWLKSEKLDESSGAGVQTLDDKRLLQDTEHWISPSMLCEISEVSRSLPSSLFIPSAVCTRDIYPTFGGGFGDIYRGTVDGKAVALKRMRHFPQGSDLPRIHVEFCREALLWKDLHHPYILPLIGIDQDSFPDFLCMVSPWMEHGTVIDYLKKYGHDIVDNLLYEIAQGLEYLHSRGIIHGDLKGANILIQENWTACLADFGLSGFPDASTSMSSDRGGSVYWMAPELLDPLRDRYIFAQTPATDIYAFGCVCFELYTGRPPFADVLDVVAATKIIAGERPVRPSSSPAMSDLLWQHVTSYWGQSSTSRPETRQVVENMRRHTSLALPIPFSSQN